MQGFYDPTTEDAKSESTFDLNFAQNNKGNAMTALVSEAAKSNQILNGGKKTAVLKAKSKTGLGSKGPGQASNDVSSKESIMKKQNMQKLSQLDPTYSSNGSSLAWYQLALLNSYRPILERDLGCQFLASGLIDTPEQQEDSVESEKIHWW